MSDEDEHGPWDKEQQRYADGCKSEAGLEEDPRLAQVRALCDEVENRHPVVDPPGVYQLADDIRAIVGAPPVAATQPQGIDRDALRRGVAIILNLLIASGAHYPEDVSAATDEILAIVRPVEGAHLDPERAAGVLDWCKREGGLDLYGWGDLISRLQDCIVPLPADAPSKVSEAYRRGYSDAQAKR